MDGRRIRFGVIILRLLLSAALEHSVIGQVKEASPQPSADPSLVRIAHHLQRVHQDEFHNVIPRRVRTLQTRFKHALREFIVEQLNQSEMANQNLRSIRRAILRKLRGLKIFDGFKEYGPNYTYGHVLDVSIESVPRHVDLLAIQLIIDADWDEDESLYLVQWQGTTWVNILAAEVNNYALVSYAQSSRFNYGVSPPAEGGSWFLVTSSVNAHRASAWQHVTYTAWTPGPDANHPRILVRRTNGIYLAGSGDESHACQIKTTVAGFRVSFNIAWDTGGEDLRLIDEYSVTNGAAKRIALRCRTRNILGQSVSCDPRNDP